MVCACIRRKSPDVVAEVVGADDEVADAAECFVVEASCTRVLWWMRYFFFTGPKFYAREGKREKKWKIGFTLSQCLELVWRRHCASGGV